MNATANIPVWFHLLSCRRLFGSDFVTFFSWIPKVMATFNWVGLNEVRGVPERYLSIQGWHSQFFSIWAEFNSQDWKKMSNFICIYQYLLIILQCCKRMQKIYMVFLTIWGKHNIFFGSFTLKDVPEFDGFVPGSTGQESLVGAEAQGTDRALMSSKHLSTEFKKHYHKPWYQKIKPF